MPAVHGHVAAVVKVVVGQKGAVQLLPVQSDHLATLEENAAVCRHFRLGSLNAPDAQFVNPEAIGKTASFCKLQLPAVAEC